MVTRVVPLSSAASSVVIMSEALIRWRLYSAPRRNKAVVCASLAYGSAVLARRALKESKATEKGEVNVFMAIES